MSALGSGTAPFWDALRSGRSGIAPLEGVDSAQAQLRFSQGAEVRGYKADEHFPGSSGAMLDRFAQFAVVAAREAVRDAKVEWNPELSEEAAVVTGSSGGGLAAEDEQYLQLYGRQGRVHPFTIPRIMSNAGASQICSEMGLRGAAFNLSTACASSTHAIGLAYWMVRNQQCGIAITGGSEAPFTLGMLKAWDGLRVVSTDTCRPFSLGRKGMILGEGAAMLVLEPLDAARARGASIYAEIIGFGMSADAGHITHPDAKGAVRAMTRALKDASLQPSDIGYVNAHGTGTEVNDATETAALHDLFGAHADRLAVSSSKSMHGHALGAAGALEAAATVLALKSGILPPTANYTDPDPKCDLDVIPNEARASRVEFALSNSFAFGGLNAVLAFRAA